MKAMKPLFNIFLIFVLFTNKAMKPLFNIFLIIVLFTNNACSQNEVQKLHGEWSLSPEYDEADIIIFRSNNTYLVYNELDYESLNPEKYDYNIFLDDGLIRTARTEIGRWTYDQATNQITLKGRNFIKENSQFNVQHGKEEELVFKINQITEGELILCSVEEENSCDKYIKTANFTGKGDKLFYREITEEFSGTGSQVKEILLSGYETAIKLSYDFFKEPDQLIIRDRSGKELFATEMVATSEEVAQEISLRGVTKLVFEIKASKGNSQWKIKAEIK